MPQFKLDGANFGAEDTTLPYSVTWNSTTVANGSHTLAAVARDAAGNMGTSGSSDGNCEQPSSFHHHHWGNEYLECH